MECISRKQYTSVVAVLVALFFMFPFLLRGASIDELSKNIEEKNQEIKKLEEEEKKYRDELAARAKQGKTLKEELARINGEINKLKRDITLTEKKIQKTKLEIEALGLDIHEKEASIRKLRGGLAGIIQSFSEQTQESTLELLIKYNTLAEFFQNIDYGASLKHKIISSLDTLKKLQQELRAKHANAQEKKGELEELEDSLKDRKSIREVTQRDRATLLQKTKNEEKLYQNLLAENEKRQEELFREMEKLEEELRKLVDPDSLPPARKGLLLAPVDGIVTQGYGDTPFVRGAGRDFYKFHNGIDMRAPIGTPIRAADEGTVLAIGDTDRYCWRGAYGKYIVLNHPNNLSTMYAHLSLIRVQSGQVVHRGDIIGYTGNSGLSMGPHLHFTLYDSRTVELRLGPRGTCGILPLGGSLNPMIYL